MDTIKKIKSWLEGDQDYKAGLELYYNNAIGQRRIFPGTPTCEQCKKMLKAELESLLQLLEIKSGNTQESHVSSDLNDELLAADLDTLPWPEMKSLFARLDLEAPSAKKVDILAALKAAQLKLQKPE